MGVSQHVFLRMVRAYAKLLTDPRADVFATVVNHRSFQLKYSRH